MRQKKIGTKSPPERPKTDINSGLDCQELGRINEECGLYTQLPYQPIYGIGISFTYRKFDITNKNTVFPDGCNRRF
ncbi:MAG: hypothetical protein JWN56_638 [Sphingobacteriales bacterium]|nr:hypothetical protein [Sphingobacteriales bacterium]